MASERTYEVMVAIRHHDDSGALDVQVSMRYEQEPWTLLLDATDAVEGRGVVRERAVSMVRSALRMMF